MNSLPPLKTSHETNRDNELTIVIASSTVFVQPPPQPIINRSYMYNLPPLDKPNQNDAVSVSGVTAGSSIPFSPPVIAQDPPPHSDEVTFVSVKSSKKHSWLCWSIINLFLFCPCCIFWFPALVTSLMARGK